MKIIVEENIPFIKGVLENVGDVTYLSTPAIDADAVREADAMFVRTRNRCNAEMLEGSNVKFVATATIGLDHIDCRWCRENGIYAVNAPGCNAPAVAQYVMAAILATGLDPREVTLGVVGAGHVGKIVVAWGRSLGMEVLVNDPPRALAEGPEGFVSLDEIAERCNVVTFHTPLTKEGAFASWHLCDMDFVSKLRRRPLLINAARGAVCCTAALIQGLDSGVIGNVAIDCWEGEPDNISLELMKRAAIATSHIAGYSMEGKIRATAMTLDSFTRYFGLPQLLPTVAVPAAAPEKVTEAMIHESYDIMADDRAFRADPGGMERLRDTYALRSEPRRPE